MLEQNHAQLVNGIQELYHRAINGQAWVGPPLNTLANGHPHIHDILDSLGALKRDSRSGSAMFEEDLEILQQKLIASGAGFMQQHDSPDSDSDQTQGPMSGVEPAPVGPFFPEPFAASSGLPTPPMHTPPARLSLQIPREAQFRPESSYSPPSHGEKVQTSMNPAVLHRQSWPQPVLQEDPMDFLRFDVPSYDNVKQMQFTQIPIDMRAMSPLAVPDWNEDDFNAYLNQSIA